MKMFVGLRAALGMLAALGLAVAVAPAAQAYPEVIIHAHVSDTTVTAGATFTASSSANVECAWTHEWNGTTHHGAGTDFSSQFTAPQVQRREVIPVHFTCTYASTAGPATARRTIDVTVLPRKGSSQVLAPGGAQGEQAGRQGSGRAAAQAGPAAAGVNGAASTMPDTGGPNVLFLLLGLLLLVAGTVAVRLARTRVDGDADGPRA